MASARDIKKRIVSVKSTKKITRTMELVSTAKSKKAVDRVQAAMPFASKTQELIGSLVEGSTIHHPLLRVSDKPNKVALLVTTANRGLCGAFNNNVVKLSMNRYEELKKEGVEVNLYIIGKKGISVFKFNNYEIEETYTHIDDRPTFEQAQEFADLFIKLFSEEKIDGAEIIYTKYFSAGSQRAHIQSVLPLQLKSDDEAEASFSGETIFEPGPEAILYSLLPRAVRVMYYRALLDSAASEQIARRIAMKNATDAASDIIKDMTLQYNRARQAKITQEIAEIVSGAESVS